MMKTRSFAIIMSILILWTGASFFWATVTPTPILPAYMGVTVLRTEFSAGSGFVFAEDESFYYVATAEHVVEDLAEIEVDEVRSKVIARDFENDVAIVRVKKNKIMYPVYPLGSVDLEDRVKAVGYTWGNGWEADPTFMVYHGRVTCLNWDKCLSSNSGVFPGMSGGPLFNENHEVVGIVSRVGGAWGGAVSTLSIFVPIERLTELWDEYQENQDESR